MMRISDVWRKVRKLYYVSTVETRASDIGGQTWLARTIQLKPVPPAIIRVPHTATPIA